MLRYKADIRTLIYMVVTTAILVLEWNVVGFNIFLYVASLFFAVSVAVIAHNHNHLPMWRSKPLNVLTDYWLTLFYGFPAFGWIPTHNKNHHFFNNKEGDYTITYRITEKNHLFSLTSYPSISSFHQQKPIFDYIKMLWQTDRKEFFLAVLQYVALGVFYAVTFYMDWKKALIFIAIPHQVSLFSVLVFNYVQHVHADEESPIDHSRNITGPVLNAMLFNNGFHTAHHERAGIHWSETPKAHRKIEANINPVLNERSFWGYIIKAYFIAPFNKKYATKSMRLERMSRS
ncbi:MAG: fatty acid desaturase [bacterium]